MGVWGGCSEACTYPHGTRAPGPLSEKRVKWPRRKCRKVGLGTARRRQDKVIPKAGQPSVPGARSAAGAGVLPCPTRVSPQPPFRPGDLPQQPLPWVLAQGSPCTASRSGPLTKGPSPPRAARAFILWNFLRKTFSGWCSPLGGAGSGTRTWPGRSSRARDARRARSRNLCPAPRHCSLCLPLLRRDTSAHLAAGGLVTWSVWIRPDACPCAP